jgi:hypothetical protein
MKGNGDRNVEEMLRSAELKPAPPGLRERVLEAAVKHKEEAGWMTPLLRWCLAGCAVALSVIFIADGLVARTQRDRLQALFDGSPSARNPVDDASRMLAEVYGQSLTGKMLAQNELVLAQKLKASELRREDMIRELLKEDFDGSESTKNNH